MSFENFPLLLNFSFFILMSYYSSISHYIIILLLHINIQIFILLTHKY